MSITAQRMDSSQIETYLGEPRHAIVAVLRQDGSPQLSPVWFLYEGERLYFSIGVSSAKYRQLRRDPRLSVCIDAGHPDARSVVVSGSAEIIEADSPERADIDWRILRRYHDSDEAALSWQKEAAADGPSALVAVSPERIVGWDYN